MVRTLAWKGSDGGVTPCGFGGRRWSPVSLSERSHLLSDLPSGDPPLPQRASGAAITEIIVAQDIIEELIELVVGRFIHFAGIAIFRFQPDDLHVLR